MNAATENETASPVAPVREGYELVPMATLELLDIPVNYGEAGDRVGESRSDR